MPSRFSDKMFGPAKQMAKAGRFGDTILAHINPQEAALLKARGGSGTTNPVTGALEFATREEFDPDFYIANNPDVAAAGYGTGEGQMDPFDHYNTFINEGSETRAANFDERQQQDLGAFTGVFDPDYYLSQNQDVADALSGGLLGDITTARGHFDVFGQKEKRTGNQTQQNLKDAGFEGTFGGGQFGGQSQFARERAVNFSGRASDEQPDNPDPMALANSRFLNSDQNNLRADLAGSGEGFFDLLGNTSTMLTPDLMSTLEGRELAINTGYTGGFQPGTLNAFRGDYSDLDNDPETTFTAANTSNISTAGINISPIRDALRELGYEGEFGAGGTDAFVEEQLGEFLLNDAGNLTDNLRNIRTEKAQKDASDAQQKALTDAIALLAGATSGSTTSDLTVDPPSGIDVDTGVDAGVVTVDPIDFDTPTQTPDGVSFTNTQDTVFDPFTGTFRRTRINPFTGALEYLPDNPRAFSQNISPLRRGGFGDLIVV